MREYKKLILMPCKDKEMTQGNTMEWGKGKGYIRTDQLFLKNAEKLD